jgi:4-amino-4-deoxy-L-arabinose transferase-like glycosyltransferase
MRPAFSVGWRDHIIGVVLMASYVAVLLNASLPMAMSRDESFYVDAAQLIAPWIEHAYEDFETARDPAVIARHWEYNHEHPALMKASFAIAWLAHQKWELFPTDSSAFRFPGMLCGGFLLWLVYIFGARAHSRVAGLFGAAAFGLLPRVFYHSQLDCFDIPIVLMLTLSTYCYWRSLERPWWAVWTGVAYGLALATKHNAWILPGVLFIHWVWVVFGEIAARRRGEPKTVSLVPWWLIGMAAIGPAIFVGTWPWLWDDGVERFRWYANFHLNHVHYHMVYFGKTYIHPPFPMSFPWVLTAFTVPATTLVLGLIGFGIRARAVLPGPIAARLWSKGAVAPDRRYTDVLFLGSMLAPMIVISHPETPIFGGTKHWFPAYPFLAIYAGIGFARLIDALLPRLPLERLRPLPGGARSSLIAPPVVALAGALLLLPAAIETVHSHPFGLSHYTFFAGHVPGAADHGMNRQFWGFTQGSLAPWMKEQMPEGGTVWPGDATGRSWEMMQRDGILPRDIRTGSHMAHTDYVLIHHEHHFVEVDGQAWVALGTVKPVHVLTYDGVPIITVYENPRRRLTGTSTGR